MRSMHRTVDDSPTGADGTAVDHPLPSGPVQAVPGGYGSADAYDRYMGRWSALLARQLLEFANVSASKSILDVGCGTGSLTKIVAESISANLIVGIDPIEQFIHSARRKVRDQRVVFEYGKAEQLPYAQGSFDTSLAQLCVHHFSDGDRAIREISRVTRSGGIVAACEWDAGSGMEMFQVLFDSLESVLPGESSERPARNYATEGELSALWKTCGLRDVEETALTVQLRFADFEDFWVPVTEGPSSVYKQYCRLSPLMQDEFQLVLKRRLLAGWSDGPFTLNAKAWAVKGRVA